LVSNLRYCRHNSSDNTVKVFVWLNLIFIENIFGSRPLWQVFDYSVLNGNNNLTIYHQKRPYYRDIANGFELELCGNVFCSNWLVTATNDAIRKQGNGYCG